MQVLISNGKKRIKLNATERATLTKALELGRHLSLLDPNLVIDDLDELVHAFDPGSGVYIPRGPRVVEDGPVAGG